MPDTGGLLSSLNANTLWASLLWGSIGSGMAIYGWKQKSMVPLGGGIVMVALSYFVGSAMWMSLASIGTIAAMWWLKKQGY